MCGTCALDEIFAGASASKYHLADSPALPFVPPPKHFESSSESFGACHLRRRRRREFNRKILRGKAAYGNLGEFSKVSAETFGDERHMSELDCCHKVCLLTSAHYLSAQDRIRSLSANHRQHVAHTLPSIVACRRGC